MAKKILVADPDENEAKALSIHLRGAGYTPVPVVTGEEIIRAALSELPALIIMEAVFPGLSGFEICKQLQASPGASQVPVIMISGQADPIDRILGLELGAEDYLPKPYHPRELLLRIRKVIARSRLPSQQGGRVQIGELQLDRDRCEAHLRGRRVPLTSIEFRLLFLMADRLGRVQTRERLMRDVWGYDAEINSRTLDTHIRKIRAKLGDHGEYVETAYGFGYRVVEEIPSLRAA